MNFRLLVSTTLLAAGLSLPTLAQDTPPVPPAQQGAAVQNPDSLNPDDPEGMLEDADDADDGEPGTPGSAMAPAERPADETGAQAPSASPPPPATESRRDNNRASRKDGSKGEKLTRQFKRADKNNDGYVDGAEMDAFRLRPFNKMDGNGDGQLDATELEAARAIRQERAEAKAKASGRTLSERKMNRDPYRRLDTDRNGIITRDEYLAPPRAAMRRGDADADGRISESELSAALSRRPRN